ncbi:N-formylglutamate amidohydrolase [Maritalea sp.]|uniref:N-formylglutamate amidohydrolase n=1 Tax=Maritalea sp. TaxID=2003361 RepID=UPI003EF4573A
MREETFDAVELVNVAGRSSVLLICEHAANNFPRQFADLGLSEELKKSHIAWDPGAREVSVYMGELLDAQVILGKVSRLIYDCNRPPEAVDAVPTHSEIFDVPGNFDLSSADYQDRVERCFVPFSDLVAKTIRWHKGDAVIVTIHSFTPVYKGENRGTEIGILCDSDDRLARKMMELSSQYADFKFALNEPYGPKDGVTFTLKKHGVENGLHNVMIEVRNDLISTADQQRRMATILADLVTRSLARLDADDEVEGS